MGATDSNCCGGREQPNRLIEQEMNSSRQKHAIERNTEIKPIKHETIQVDEYILHKDSAQYLSFERMNKIKVDDQIDYRNDYGKFMGYNVFDKKGTILTLENCNDDEKSDTIDIDYTKTVNRFAEYGSISKREAHRFLDLIMEDYIDINKDGWRYGEIIAMDKFSGQIQVGFLDSDANYDDYWFHLDNEFQVAKCNTKCDIIMSLKQHIYDPFFNIKKHKNQGKLMMERLEKCFVYIETKILPEKIQEGRLSLISYLNDVYFQLYIESIACEMKGSISCDDMKIMKELFQQKYDPLVETLKTATDEMHPNHVEFLATNEWREACTNGTACPKNDNYSSAQLDYLGDIPGTDVQIQRVLDLLKQYNATDNTLIWFTSDNGPEGDSAGPYGNTQCPSSPNGLRGRKRLF